MEAYYILKISQPSCVLSLPTQWHCSAGIHSTVQGRVAFFNNAYAHVCLLVDVWVRGWWADWQDD